jgi:hypothetical protein
MSEATNRKAGPPPTSLRIRRSEDESEPPSSRLPQGSREKEACRRLRSRSRKPHRPHGLPWTRPKGPNRHPWLQRPWFRARAAALPASRPSMWQPKGQRARGTPERGRPAREIRGSSEMAGSSPPFRTSATHGARFTPCLVQPEAACRLWPAWKPVATDRNLLQASNAHRGLVPLASWSPATGEGFGPRPVPIRSGCSHPERSGNEARMKRPLLTPFVASATRSGRRTHLPARAERPSKARSPSHETPQGVPRQGGVGQDELPRRDCSREWRRSSEEPKLPPCHVEAKPKEATSDSRWQHFLPRRT